MGAFENEVPEAVPALCAWEDLDNGAVARPGSGWEVNGGGVKATVIYALIIGDASPNAT